MHPNPLLAPFLSAVLFATACASDELDDRCTAVFGSGFGVAEATSRRCVAVDQTVEGDSQGSLWQEAISLCYIARPPLGPAGVYRVASMAYVQESMGGTDRSEDGGPPAQTFVYADMDLVEAWEDGAAERMVARAYDTGTWPDSPETVPPLTTGESYLVFIGEQLDGSRTLGPNTVFVRENEQWRSDTFSLPLEYERIRDRLAQARQHFVDGGIDRNSSYEATGERLASCPDALRGNVFE